MKLSLLTSIALPFLLQGTAAETSATITAAPATTDLPSLVALLPTCALSCFASAASDISCAVTNITCICANSGALVKEVGPCIGFDSECRPADISNVTDLAPKICDAANGNVTGSAISEVSSMVSSALATVTGTATAAAGGRPEPGVGLGGVLGLGALVALGALVL